MGQALLDLGRFVTFRFGPEDYDRIGRWHLAWGVLSTWAVGIARNWDYPQAPLFARLGLASVAYIVFMGLVLFVFSRPISGEKRGYGWMLTMVAMTAPPGLVYGVPVERMMPLENAQQANLVFLGLVATWRVALAVHMLWIGCRAGATAFAALLAPICLIVIGLVHTGRAGYVMQIMGGVRDAQRPAVSAVDATIATLYCLAWPVLFLSAVGYLSIAFNPRPDSR